MLSWHIAHAEFCYIEAEAILTMLLNCGVHLHSYLHRYTELPEACQLQEKVHFVVLLHAWVSTTAIWLQCEQAGMSIGQRTHPGKGPSLLPRRC